MKCNTSPKIKMRLLILAALMLSTLAAGAQRETIKFAKTQLTVREALAEIKTQAGYGLAFNGQQFDADRTVTLTSAELTFAEAMKQILDGSGSTYALNDNFISITKSAEVPVNEVAATPRKSDPVSDDIYRPDPAPDLNAGPQPAQTENSVIQPKPAPVTVADVPRSESDSQSEPVSRDSITRIWIPTVGLKTNLLYDLTATINLGLEFRLGGRSSLDVPVNWNPFTFSDNRKWRHVLVQPELRLWTRETFEGHFFGLHAHYAFYNVGNLPHPPFSQYMRDHRFQGWLAGAGVSYGYRWNFNPRWGMEATVGVGYAYLDYEKFDCELCGKSYGKKTKHYFGPTKVGLSLIYNIGRRMEEVSVSVPVYVPVYVPPVVTQPEPEVVPEPVVIPPYTPRFAVSYVVPEAEAVKVRSEAGKAYLDFAVGKADIVPSFKGNAAELDKIYAMIRDVRQNPDATITGITITGYASPEGAWATNKTLSEKRAQALKDQIKMVTGYADSFFTVEGKGEDWATLDSLVAQSNMTDKYAVLAIIRGTDVFDGRERRLMALSGGNPYRAMKEGMFPQLRRTEYQLQYTVLPFTVEKGKEVFKTRPSSLSLNEIYLIANTYAPGSDEFNEVIETAARMFPQDDAANLNAAASALERGDAVQAEKYLSRVKGRTAEYHNNMGVLHGLRGEWDKVAAAFVRASAMGGSAEAEANIVEINRKLGNMEAIKDIENQSPDMADGQTN